jgi:hypothetical protein
VVQQTVQTNPTIEKVIVDQNRMEAVKKSKFVTYAADTEMHVACTLNKLRVKTPCFAYNTGWGLVNNEFVTAYEWASVEYDGHEMFSFMFLVIHALAWATKELGRGVRLNMKIIRAEYLRVNEALYLEVPGDSSFHYVLSNDVQFSVPRLFLSHGLTDPVEHPLIQLKSFFMEGHLDDQFDYKEIAFLTSPEYTYASRRPDNEWRMYVDLLERMNTAKRVETPKRIHFHLCSETLGQIPMDDALLSEFLREFRVVSVRGEGSFGLVVEVHDFLGHAFAVKFVHFQPTLVQNEINITCRLPYAQTPVFTQMHGWLHFKDIPFLARQLGKLHHTYQNNGYVAMISDLNTVELRQDPLDAMANAQCFLCYFTDWLGLDLNLVTFAIATLSQTT